MASEEAKLGTRICTLVPLTVILDPTPGVPWKWQCGHLCGDCYTRVWGCLPPKEKIKPCSRIPEWGKNSPHRPRSAAAQVGDCWVKGGLSLWAEISEQGQGSRATNTILDHFFLGIAQESILYLCHNLTSQVWYISANFQLPDFTSLETPPICFCLFCAWEISLCR